MLLCAVPLGGCASRFHHRDDIDTVSLAELRSLRDAAATDAKSLLLIDSRSPEEFREGRIPGAINRGLIQFDPNKGLDKRIASFETIVIYGQDSNSPSARAITKRMMAMSYEDVRLFRGGYDEWRERGLEIEVGPAATGAE